MRVLEKERETDIVRAILDYLKVKQILAWRMPVQGVMQTRGGTMGFKPSPIAGFPDIACMFRGLFVCFEVKRKTGRVSEKQTMWISQLREHGAHAFVVRSVGEVEDVLERLRGEIKC